MDQHWNKTQVQLQLSDRPEESYTSYDELKEAMEKAIRIAKREVFAEIDEDFFETVSYKVLNKEREEPEKRVLVSEEDTRFENVTDTPVRYSFSGCHEQQTSFSLQSTNGYSVGIGMTTVLGAVTMGPKLGFNKSQTKSDEKAKTNSKTLTVDGEIATNEVATVKELVYIVSSVARCNVSLTVSDKERVPYSSAKGRDADREVSIKTLLNAGLLNRAKGVEQGKKSATIHLQTNCTFEKSEHTLEVLKSKMTGETVERITSAPYTSPPCFRFRQYTQYTQYEAEERRKIASETHSRGAARPRMNTLPLSPHHDNDLYV